MTWAQVLARWLVELCRTGDIRWFMLSSLALRMESPQPPPTDPPTQYRERQSRSQRPRSESFGQRQGPFRWTKQRGLRERDCASGRPSFLNLVHRVLSYHARRATKIKLCKLMVKRRGVPPSFQKREGDGEGFLHRAQSCFQILFSHAGWTIDEA